MVTELQANKPIYQQVLLYFTILHFIRWHKTLGFTHLAESESITAEVYVPVGLEK